MFDEKTGPMMNWLLSNRRELAQTRDLLPAKLMSGEIRLRDTGRMVEEAA